jgi:lysophospholipase L1-like esterase
VSLYAREQEVRLDPIGLHVHEGIRAKSGAHARPVLAMFGDSRIAMWPPPAIDGYDVVNLGVGHQTSEQALLRFDEDVAPLHPALVLVQVGVNDLKTVPLFPERHEAIVRECKANIQRIIDKSRALGARVLLTTIFSLGDVPVYRRVVWSPGATARAIDEVNASLRSLALTNSGVTVIDSATILDDAPGKIKEAFQLDYLHENAAAYAALDKRVVQLVHGFGAVPR